MVCVVHVACMYVQVCAMWGVWCRCDVFVVCMCGVCDVYVVCVWCGIYVVCSGSVICVWCVCGL